jgi:putative transposase
MAKTVMRAYRYRFYPSPDQETELLRTFGCVRKVWNLALDARTAAWYQRAERVSYVQSSAMLTEWKKTGDLAYLNEVSSVPLQQALRHLQGRSPRSGTSGRSTLASSPAAGPASPPSTPARHSAGATASSGSRR